MKKIVYLDAGHGGHDPGALGPNGEEEKAVVLSVCQLVKKHADEQDLPFEIRLTRQSDLFLKLSKRAEIANANDADVFVSVHCNSAHNPAQGIETFCARKSARGYKLAESIQEAQLQVHELVDRGVKRANFTVLTKTKMPACLLEMGFIHTEHGAALLTSWEFIENTALGILDGLLDYYGEQPLNIRHDEEEPHAMGCHSRIEEIDYHARKIIYLKSKQAEKAGS